MKPGGESEAALLSVAQRQQFSAKGGGSIQINSTLGEAANLRDIADYRKILPEPEWREVSEVSKDIKNDGLYIWRTASDSKVRSTHANREGKVYSWSNPPEGGHPGEDFNCRCRAEERDCTIQWVELRDIVKELVPLGAELSQVNRKIHNLRITIEQNRAGIKDLEIAASILAMGRVLDFIPHPLARAVKVASQITKVMVAVKLRTIRAEFEVNLTKLKELEKEQPELGKKVRSLKIKERIAQQAHDKCMGR